VLAQALGEDPAALRFDYGSHGKPCLGGTQATSGLAFNASHTGERLLIGLSWRAAIGVDIERHRPTINRDGLVRRYFSAAENHDYFALPEADRQQGFFDCWARKEAVVKAIGRGLAFPLKDFDVAFTAGRDGLVRLQADSGEASGWCLAGFAAEPGLSAAVVLPGKYCTVRPVS
jgi:4'-phosphopantetheinyl transferase